MSEPEITDEEWDEWTAQMEQEFWEAEGEKKLDDLEFERHAQINREYQQWLISLGVLRENKRNDSKQIPQERGFPVT